MKGLGVSRLKSAVTLFFIALSFNIVEDFQMRYKASL